MTTMKKFAEFVGEASSEISIKSQAPHYFFGTHIRYIYYFHVIGTSIVSIIGIVLSLVAFVYPHLHRESPVYTQILQRFERANVHSYYFWYHFIVFFFLGDFIVQIVTSLVGIFGTKKKLAGSINLIDVKDHVALDGLNTKGTQNKPFVPKLIRANLLFSVATDQMGKYFHWFLFETKSDYNEFCDAVCTLIGKIRIPRKAPRSPSVDPSKRKSRSRSAAPNKYRLRKANDERPVSRTPNPIRRHFPNEVQQNSFFENLNDN
ncbi:hypothetical protein FO519_008878 [Halicephalobus sp. NKZ332]|nr:hypothetical protein FO519_008878 [Halicephalobus sp. NKZ332]